MLKPRLPVAAPTAKAVPPKVRPKVSAIMAANFSTTSLPPVIGADNSISISKSNDDP